MTTPLIKLENVTINAPSAQALARKSNIDDASQHTVLVNKVSFDVASGEVLAIIGPNGAGKSTLLNTIAGDHEYTGLIEICLLYTSPSPRDS